MVEEKERSDQEELKNIIGQSIHYDLVQMDKFRSAKSSDEEILILNLETTKDLVIGNGLLNAIRYMSYEVTTFDANLSEDDDVDTDVILHLRKGK